MEQQRGDGLGVGDLAAVERVQHLVQRHRDDVEKFAVVERSTDMRQPLGDKEVDPLVRVGNERVNRAERRPLTSAM